MCRLVKLKCDCIPLFMSWNACQNYNSFCFEMEGGMGLLRLVIVNHPYYYQKDKKTLSDQHKYKNHFADQPLAGYCRINNMLSQSFWENITYWSNLTSFQVKFRFTNLSAPLQRSSSFPSMFLTITDIRFLELLNSKIFKSL